MADRHEIPRCLTKVQIHFVFLIIAIAGLDRYRLVLAILVPAASVSRGQSLASVLQQHFGA